MTSHPYFDTGGTIAALAHRGFSLEGLENSMLAFQAAVDLGYRYVETDAHGTADGIAVALHDASLDRTTDAQGQVSSLPWSRVQSARIGGVEPVPLLEDLLGAWPELRVNIDVKAKSGIEPIAAAIERTKAHDRVCITSFSTARRKATLAKLSHPVATSAGTREVGAFLLGTRLGASANRPLSGVDALQVPVAAGPLTVVSAHTLAAAHRAKKPVHVWTVNDRHEMERLVDLGVDGIVTDRADLLKDVLIQHGRWH
jgi:glycerophosphoryl diester phosphodiesterase